VFEGYKNSHYKPNSGFEGQYGLSQKAASTSWWSSFPIFVSNNLMW